MNYKIEMEYTDGSFLLTMFETNNPMRKNTSFKVMIGYLFFKKNILFQIVSEIVILDSIPLIHIMVLAKPVSLCFSCSQIEQHD